jgi:hypothetical protein
MKIAAIAATILLVTASAQASTLQFPDVQKVQALRGKLQTATVDVTQAMEQASAMKNYEDQRCLGLLHDQTQEAALITAAVGDFMALSIARPARSVAGSSEETVRQQSVCRAVPGRKTYRPDRPGPS